MKLNQYHKQAIIRAIEQDIPKKASDTTRDEVQRAIYKAMGKSCQSMYRTNPKALRTEYVGSLSLDGAHRTFVVGDADFKKVLDPFQKEASKREDALRALRNAIEACTTRKQFIDRFPEFSNYAPSEHDKCSTLPALANVVAGLIEIGFVPKVEKA